MQADHGASKSRCDGVVGSAENFKLMDVRTEVVEWPSLETATSHSHLACHRRQCYFCDTGEGRRHASRIAVTRRALVGRLVVGWWASGQKLSTATRHGLRIGTSSSQGAVPNEPCGTVRRLSEPTSAC
jgi:hypothetical protein